MGESAVLLFVAYLKNICVIFTVDWSFKNNMTWIVAEMCLIIYKAIWLKINNKGQICQETVSDSVGGE